MICRCVRAILQQLLLSALTMTAGTVAQAGDGRCAHCGAAGPCHKVCRLVCEDKKVSITCWGCETEDFCVPGPSKPGCRHCETVCDEDSDPQAPCAHPQKFVWTEWLPNCSAKMFTKHKLMKKTVTKTIPGYKWVVEDLCPQCQASVGTAAK